MLIFYLFLKLNKFYLCYQSCFFLSTFIISLHQEEVNRKVSRNNIFCEKNLFSDRKRIQCYLVIALRNAPILGFGALLLMRKQQYQKSMKLIVQKFCFNYFHLLRITYNGVPYHSDKPKE